MNDESTKSAVLTKCEDVANVILDNDWSVAKSPTIAGKFYMEQGDSENFLTLSEDLPSDAWQWGVAAEILKITPSIDEFEDDLSRRQYHHDLEVARKEGYEQGKAEASARPSDALFLKCWDTAIQHSRRATTTGSISLDEAFFDWLATIPPDTLKADRELVKNIFRVSESVKVSRGTKLWASIARLAGMEAPNE